MPVAELEKRSKKRLGGGRVHILALDMFSKGAFMI